MTSKAAVHAAAKDARRVAFAEFELDLRAGELTRAGRPVALTRKALQLLSFLVSRSGEVVSRDEVFAHVWSGRIVSDAALNKRVQELRRGLGDDAERPMLLETLPGRGYRFIGPVTTRALRESPSGAGQVALAGRERERRLLAEALSLSVAGERQVVLISGDAGFGKTALVDELVRSATAHCIGRGQCLDLLGYGEPRLPVLEAITRLCRDQPEIRAVLLQRAPTWMVHLTGLLSDEELDAVRHRAEGATASFMLRELNDALEYACQIHPLLLVLEDVHWADASTLAALMFLAASRADARLMIVATIRSGERHNAALPQALAVLRAQGTQRSIELSALQEEEVTAWLLRRFPHAPSEPLHALARAVYRHCEGHPLFLHGVVDGLLDAGILYQSGLLWHLDRPVEACVLGVPDTVAQFIDDLLARCSDEQRHALEAAAILGSEFAPADVRALLGVHTAERALAGMLDARRMVRAGNGAGGAFVHHLVRERVLQQLPDGRRRELHARAAAVLQDRYGVDAGALARHYEGAGEPLLATQWLQRAGEEALTRSAHPEATLLLRRGIEQLQLLPQSAIVRRLEVGVHACLGVALVVSEGYTSVDAQCAFEHVRTLATGQTDTDSHLFTALHGLRINYLLRAELAQASALDAQMIAMARRTDMPGLAVWGDVLRAETLYMQGELGDAMHLLERLYRELDDRADYLRATATWARPSAGILGYYALVLAEMGRVDSAVRVIEEALQRPSVNTHPYSLAFVHYTAAQVYIARLEYPKATPHLVQLRKVTEEYGFQFLQLMGDLMDAYIGVEVRADSAECLRRAQTALAALTGMEVRLGRGMALSMCGAVLAHSGDLDGCLRLMDEGLAAARATGERLREATLAAGRGIVMLRHRKGPAKTIGDGSVLDTGIQPVCHVGNDPLSYTDPSGFFALNGFEIADDSCSTICIDYGPALCRR